MTYPRVLAAGQRSQIWIGGPRWPPLSSSRRPTASCSKPPTGPSTGKSLVLNGDGGLWTLSLTSPDAGPDRVDLGQLPDLNNDHVLSPDGEHVYLSAMDTHIYRAPLAGGAAERVTPEDGMWHFCTEYPPTAQRLAYVQISDMAEPGQLAILESDSSVSILDVGAGHLDGPEWSPDGRWIYLNTETFTSTRGTPSSLESRTAADRSRGC